MNTYDARIQKAVQKILIGIADGDPESIELTCPRCGHSPLIYSFAVNRPPRYGLYIHCKNCHLFTHLALALKPRNFREDLILPYYQKLENDAMEFSKNLLDKVLNPDDEDPK